MATSSNVAPHLEREIEGRISKAFARHEYPALRKIRVAVHEGHIVLSGCVCTFHEKQLATRCAQREAGNMEIRNKIDVPSPTPR